MLQTVMVRLIRISGFGLASYFEPVFREIGISERAFHALCLLVASEHGRAAPSELSELVGTTRANMTQILDELLRDKLVSRTPHPRDGRRYDISINAAGRKRVREVVPQIIEPLKDGFSLLDAEEFALLDRLLRKLIISLDKSSRAISRAA